MNEKQPIPVSTAVVVSPEGQNAPLVVTSSRLLIFDGNGIPQMVHKNLDTVNRNIVDRMLFSATLLPYKGKRIPDPSQSPEEIKQGSPLRFIYEEEPEFKGLTNGEVAAIKMAQQAAAGDDKVFKMVMERLAGKAVEKNLNVSAKMDYQSWLEKMHGEEDLGFNPGDIDSML